MEVGCGLAHYLGVTVSPSSIYALLFLSRYARTSIFALSGNRQRPVSRPFKTPMLS